jgi:hypothetical protein
LLSFLTEHQKDNGETTNARDFACRVVVSLLFCCIVLCFETGQPHFLAIDRAFRAQQNSNMPSKLDAYRPQIAQWRLQGLPWRAIAQQLTAESEVKVRADELLRYMRRASKKAAKILAELAPLEALEAKQRSRLPEPPSRAVPKGSGPDLEKVKREIAADRAKQERPPSKWDTLEPDFRKPQP